MKIFKMHHKLYLEIEIELAGKTERVWKKLETIKMNPKVLSLLKTMSDTELSEFEETRLKPYLSMLKSRVQHKEVEHVIKTKRHVRKDLNTLVSL